MACSIVSNEWKRVTDQSYAEGDSIIRPRVSIGGRCKHELGVGPGPKIDQRNQDCKEANNVPDKEEAFKLGQPFCKANVDDHTEHDDAPIY